MQYNDVIGNQGIVQDAYFLINQDSATYPIDAVTRNVNNWYARADALFMESDGTFQYDDSNWTDYPIGRANLVIAQQDYNMFLTPPTAGEDYLRVLRVRIKDRNGNYVDIYPVDQSDLKGTSLPKTTSTGTPSTYDKFGPSLFLDPIPDYNSTDGLQVFFQRASSYFTVSDTTKKPGFPSIFHKYLSLGAAYDFAVTNGYSQNKINDFNNQIQTMEQSMRSFMSRRGKDQQVRLVNGQNKTRCGFSNFR